MTVEQLAWGNSKASRQIDDRIKADVPVSRLNAGNVAAVQASGLGKRLLSPLPLRSELTHAVAKGTAVLPLLESLRAPDH
jgi:hypothetical protein